MEISARLTDACARAESWVQRSQALPITVPKLGDLYERRNALAK